MNSSFGARSTECTSETRRMKTLFILSLILVFCACETSILGRRQATPKGWAKTQAAPENHEVTFILALKQRNLDFLEAQYWDRTNPTSPNYRRWMTISEINNIVASNTKPIRAEIKNWLQSNGAESIQDFGDAIEATASVKTLSKLFGATFYVFEHATLPKTVSVWGDYSVPKKFLDHIEMVSGFNGFPLQNLAKVKVDKKDTKRSIWDRETFVVPQTLYQMYSIPASASVTTNSSQGVIEWEQQYYSPQELSSFGTNMGVSKITTPIVVGQNFPSSPGVESTLDIQYIAATGLGAQNWFWIEAGTTWLYGFAVHFQSTQKVKHTDV